MYPSQSSEAILRDVSRETIDKLRSLEEMIIKWNQIINLVSNRQCHHMWTRHILDSAQLYYHAPAAHQSWLDIGSGAGFPGVVIAIMAADLNPSARVTLVESDGRKATFLVAAKTALGLAAYVVCSRAEALPPQNTPVLSARALASLTYLLAHADRHLAVGGTAIFPKGKLVQQELNDARKYWHFDTETAQSLTSEHGQILIVRNIKRV